MRSWGVRMVGKGGAWAPACTHSVQAPRQFAVPDFHDMCARGWCRRLANVAQIGRELELIAPHALQYGLMPTRMQLLEAGRSDLMAAIQARRPPVTSLPSCQCGGVRVPATL